MHTGQRLFAAITTIKSYQANMDLLNPAAGAFFQPGPVYTKVKDEPPTKYAAGSRLQIHLSLTAAWWKEPWRTASCSRGQ